MLKGRIAKEVQHTAQRAAPLPTHPLPQIPARQHLLSLTRDVVAIHDKLLTCEERAHAIQSSLTAADQRDAQQQQQPTAPLTGNLVEHLAEYPGEVTAYLPDDHQQLSQLRDSIVSTVQQASDSRAQHEAFLADLQHLGQDMDTTLQKVLSVSKEVQESAAAEAAAAQQRRKQRKEQLQLRLAVKQLRREAAAGADVDSSARLLQQAVSSVSSTMGLLKAPLAASPTPTTTTTSSSSSGAGGGSSMAASSSTPEAAATSPAAPAAAGGGSSLWDAEAPEIMPRVVVTGTPPAAASLAAPLPMTPPTPEATAAAAYVAAYVAAATSAEAAAGGGAAAAAGAVPTAASEVEESTTGPAAPTAAAAAAADEVVAPSTPPATPPTPPALKVQLQVAFKCPTDPGQRLYVVGSHPNLGAWDTAGAVRMKWHEGHVWRASIEVDPHCGCIEFKAYIVAEGPDRKPVGKPVWERGGNRKVEVGGADVEVMHRFTAR